MEKKKKKEVEREPPEPLKADIMYKHMAMDSFDAYMEKGPKGDAKKRKAGR